MSGTLYLVGTPIGNLGDFSPRGREILETVDFIAAEDTRVTLKLLNRFAIKKPLVSYYEHNKVESANSIIPRLLGGESCALVTDAGMPAISDPGEDLVRLCAHAGIDVVSVPGPSAVVTALALSGLPTSRFTMEGFLAVNGKARREHLAELKDEKRTMVIYEAPHKLLETLKDLLDCLGDRDIAICRELTKLHEEVFRTTLSQAVEKYKSEKPRGEYVLVIRGAPRREGAEMSMEQALALVENYRQQGKSLKEACRLAAADSGQSKNELYQASLH